MAETWKQERPTWCPHADCVFLWRGMDAMCGGRLPEAAPHDGDFNSHRYCLNGVLPNDEVFDLQVNKSDLYWFGMLFGAIKMDMMAETRECGDNLASPG